MSKAASVSTPAAFAPRASPPMPANNSIPLIETLSQLKRHNSRRAGGSATDLDRRSPGWSWVVYSVQEVGGAVVVTGRLTIPTADGDLLHYSAVASEPLESASKAPAAEVAASSCLRRAAALAGLGLELWG